MEYEKYRELRKTQEELSMVYNHYVAFPASLRDKLPSVKMKLSMFQSHVMAIIYNNKYNLKNDDMTMGQLAKKANLLHNSLTRMIDSLVKKNLVETKRSDVDKREIYVSLTKKGYESQVEEKNMKNEYMQKNIGRVMNDGDVDKLIDYCKFMVSIYEQFE